MSVKPGLFVERVDWSLGFWTEPGVMVDKDLLRWNRES